MRDGMVYGAVPLIAAITLALAAVAVGAIVGSEGGSDGTSVGHCMDVVVPGMVN